MHDTADGDDGPAVASRLDDELLAIRCQLGEPAAFDELVARWHEPLWRYIRRLSSSDDVAVDTVQDVWLRVLRAMPRLRDATRLRPWLFGIARRAVMDRLRHQYAEPDISADDVATLAEPGDEDDRAEEIAQLHEELQRMPLVECEVLVLFYLHELSLVQLAEVLDVPVGTVKSRLFRARQMLRRQLTAKGVHP